MTLGGPGLGSTGLVITALSLCVRKWMGLSKGAGPRALDQTMFIQGANSVPSLYHCDMSDCITLPDLLCWPDLYRRLILSFSLTQYTVAQVACVKL